MADDLPNWELFKYYWMLTCLLLNQKTSLRGILSSVDCLSYKAWKGYSLIPNFWDWDTHWKQSKKNWKNKALTCEIFFQHSKRNFVSPHSHVICSIHCMACTFLGVGGGGGNFCSFFPLHINSHTSCKMTSTTCSNNLARQLTWSF